MNNNEYKGIIDKFIVNSYSEALVIDVINDKLSKYVIKNNGIIFDKEESYMTYLSTCQEFVSQNDIDSYVESLSISKLEEVHNMTINYEMKTENGNYGKYVNNISLYEENGKKLIVVLVSLAKETVTHTQGGDIKSSLELKLKKLVDSVSLAILKIHNVIKGEDSIANKDEFIDSVLVGLTNEFPEFNEALNENAILMTGDGKSTVMIIDDDKITCTLIKKIFTDKYDVVMAHDGKEAIELLKNSLGKSNICCIFLDLLMPVLDGFSVLDYLNDNNYLSKLPVIIISGNYDKNTRNKAYSYQIADMLEKPFNVQVVRHRIENLIGLYKSSNSLSSILSQQHRDLKNIVNSVVNSYEMDNAKCIEMLQKYTRILAMQVSVQYPEYNINSNMIDKLAASSKYYAIGSYTMPKSILCKKGLFTEEERSIINMSNINGANIIKYVVAKSNDEIDANYCYEIAKYCNERYDGNGYPQGVSANSIPLSAQIASLAIEYNNLINTIVPLDYEKVASLIVMDSGRKFNPKIVESFKRVQADFESITKVGD